MAHARDAGEAGAQVRSTLPENAYRELKTGESYEPMVPAAARVPEVSVRSLAIGLLVNVIFSAAATFVALKVGQGIETAIPISIVAIGLSGVLVRLGRRRSSLIENVNVLAIGTTSGIVAGGTVFTMPAIYILGLDRSLGLGSLQLFLLICLVPFLGAVLGVLFLVPFRRYFVRDMHGKLPFPEATATNEILVAGGGSSVGQMVVLAWSFVAGFAYNALSSICLAFSESFSSAAVPALEAFTRTRKAVFSTGTGAEFLGLGMIIGVRYAAIIVAGSFLSWFVIVPMLAGLDLGALQALNPSFTGTEPGDIFKHVPSKVGIGCIFTAGILSILRMGKVIVTALREALGGLLRSGSRPAAAERTEQDISYPQLLGLGALTSAAIWAYFRFVVMDGLPNAGWLSIVAVLLALVVSFLFTTVSAWAIATISVTPISGMAVTTIIITAVALLAAGLPTGDAGMLIVLLVGGVVASALSMAGTLVTEFKIGYWTGATPKRIQWSAIGASLLASALVTATLMVLAGTYGYDASVRTGALQAPQANMMASALQSFIGGGSVPWTLYAVGAVVALTMQMLNVSPLAFGLGMYLPMDLNVPILLGALVSHFVARSTRDEATAKARNDRAILVASGLIAGAAILGVVKSLMSSFDTTKGLLEALAFGAGEGPAHNWLGLAAFLVLCVGVWLDCRRAKAPPAG